MGAGVGGGFCKCKPLICNGELTAEGEKLVREGRCKPRAARFVTVARVSSEAEAGGDEESPSVGCENDCGEARSKNLPPIPKDALPGPNCADDYFWEIFSNKTAASLRFVHSNAYYLLSVSEKSGIREIDRWTGRPKPHQPIYEMLRDLEDALGMTFPKLSSMERKLGCLMARFSVYSYVIRDMKDRADIGLRARELYDLQNLRVFKSPQSVWEGGNGYVATSGNDAVIVFSGTKSGRDVWADLLSMRAKPFYAGGKLVGGVGVGYAKQYAGLKEEGMIQAALETIWKLEGNCQRIHIVGHSLGGALAYLCALDLLSNDRELLRGTNRNSANSRESKLKMQGSISSPTSTDEKPIGHSFDDQPMIYIHTFGAPRVFDVKTAVSVHRQLVADPTVSVHRWVAFDDGVPDMPRRDILGHVGNAQLITFRGAVKDQKEKKTLLKGGRWEYTLRDIEYVPCDYDKVEIGYPGIHRLYHVLLREPDEFTAEVWGLGAVTKGKLRRMTTRATCLPTDAKWLIVCERGSGNFLWYAYKDRKVAVSTFENFMLPRILLEVEDGNLIERDGARLLLSHNSLRRAKQHIHRLLKDVDWNNDRLELDKQMKENYGSIYPVFLEGRTSTLEEAKYLVVLEKGIRVSILEPGVRHYPFYPVKEEDLASTIFESKRSSKVLFKLVNRQRSVQVLNGVEWNSTIAPGRTSVIAQVTAEGILGIYFNG